MKKGQPRQHYRRVTPDKRRQVIRLASKGATWQQITKKVDLSDGAVGIILKPLGGMTRREMWEPGEGRLSLDERIEIKLGLEQDRSLRAISRRIDRQPSTVSREVKANGGRHCYRPMTAHREAELRARRPKITKLAANSRLCARVIADLKAL